MNRLDVADIIGQKLIEKIRGRHHSLNAFAGVNTDQPGASKYNVGAACYAYVNNTMPQGADILISKVNPKCMDDKDRDWNSAIKSKFTRKELIKFYSWMANKSPWRTIFLTKSGSKMIDSQFVVTNAKRPSNLVIGGLTAMRQPWEYSRIIDTWLYLREHAPDLDPTFCYYLGHCLSIRRKQTGDEFTITELNGGHVAIGASYSTEAVHNLINSNPLKLNRPLPATYRGISEMWGPYGGYRYDSGWFAGNLKPKMKVAGFVDLSETLFAWNNLFYKDRKEDTERYLTAENIPIIRELFERDFGGKQ